MGDIWTPPPGFFPGALTRFMPGNIQRFEPRLVADSECQWNNELKKILEVGTACVAGVIGKSVHIWYGQPPSLEAWGTVDACDGVDYHCADIDMNSQVDCYMTIGTGVPATIHDFWRGLHQGGTAPQDTPAAIRYGWLFSTQNLAWWRYIGCAVHWLGP